MSDYWDLKKISPHFFVTECMRITINIFGKVRVMYALVLEIVAIIFEINVLDMGIPLTLSVIQNGIIFEYRKATILSRKNCCFLAYVLFGIGTLSISFLRSLKVS